MLQLFLSLLFSSVLAGDGGDLFASVGVGSASIRGFSWTYDIRNPDLTDPPGNIYWVLTDDGVSMTVEDILAGNNPTQPGCFGQDVQRDADIHEQRMDCSLTPGVVYRFWVAVDYDGDGSAAVDCTSGGVPVIPQEDKDCDGVWSTCDADCIQTYTITQYPSGDGAGCEIGDEEERACAPGTDLCPLGGSYDVYNPTPQGFDLQFDPDPTSNTAGGRWYYIVTPQGATPTDDEIKNGNGGLCGGSYDITDANNPDVQSIACQLAPDTYDVWVAQDPNGDGTATTLQPLKTVTIPQQLPIGNLFAHSPTPTGHQISYDIDYPRTTGKFYWKTLPLGAPNPTAAEIRDCPDNVCCGSEQQTDPSPLTTIQAPCPLTPGDYVVWGEVDTDGAGTDATIVNSGVPFQFTYTVITHSPTTARPTSQPTTTTTTTTTSAAATTTSAAATTTSASSSGAPQTTPSTTTTTTTTQAPITPAPATPQPATPQPVTTTTEIILTCTLPAAQIGYSFSSAILSSCTSAACTSPYVSGVVCATGYQGSAISVLPCSSTSSVATLTGCVKSITPPGMLGAYRVIYPGEECENDQIGSGMTAHIHDTILLPNVRFGYGSDVARCAGYVAQNRAQNLGCSTLFHTGGATGECRCVRLGYICDRDESEYGRSIFRLCLSTESCAMPVMIPPDVVLNKPRGDTGDGMPAHAEESSNSFTTETYLWIALAVVSGVFVGVCGYLSMQPKRETVTSHNILLDSRSI